MSLYSLPLKKTAITLNLPPTLYVAGAPVAGELELDYQLMLEDDIDRILVGLEGTIITKNRMGAQVESFKIDTNDFLRKSITAWQRSRFLPPQGDHILRIPFSVLLPEDAPPSFGFESFMNIAYVRYAVEVTGVRTGTFAVDRTIKVPIVVVEPDPLGAALRAELKLGWQGDWGRIKTEEKMRKMPWGDYSTAKMELLVPHLDTFPLFTPIPYSIIVTTISAPTKRKGTAQPQKDLFPPVPRSASEIDFDLRRHVDVKTPYFPSNPEEHVADVISKAHTPVPPVDVEITDYMWIPEEGGRDDRGCWMQEATFSSTMFLRFTPTFLTEEIKTKYMLQLKVDFPGMGNTLRVEFPIQIGSGLETSMPVDERSLSPMMIDVPA
ncbi:hypothetical protein TRAPUB_6523 [Trametes pubescens]|uniref:Arrestin-like N-terminal domain-containing protein n=1 Tax=Trametes pubescens TaxID=154538 RepID=A0A1M2W6R5_TRAPU|nr:hypothetical protein TRAPUB_6523 [Trametes pubescens]